MQLGTTFNRGVDFNTEAARIVELERAGLDAVWVAESYSNDAVSALGYLAAVTERVRLGTGILNVFSRSATAIAQTASGLDTVSGGRFVLGLGASGPQVIEGFHGIPYEKPMSRLREYIEVIRATLRRERVVHSGPTVKIPLPEGEGTGLGKPLKLINHPVRDEIPIWWASLMLRSVEETARVANGWLPIQMVPERLRDVWGDALERGLADRPAELGTLEISAPATVAISDDYVGEAAAQILDLSRPGTALYWGGMGARGKNFYNDVASAMGYADEARQIQDLYLDGRKDAAAAAVPTDFLQRANLVGPESQIAERLAAWKEAGLTMINLQLRGREPLRDLERLRDLVDEL